MHCLKCGTSVEAPEVFCPACQKEMAARCVDTSAPVYIPVHQAPPPRHSYVPPASPEEQLVMLRRRLRRQKIALTVQTLLLVALLVGLFFFGRSLAKNSYNIGQNYRVTTPTTGSATTSIK